MCEMKKRSIGLKRYRVREVNMNIPKSSLRCV